LSFPNIRTPG